jgi:DNA-directed RNA polymerase specialized sigma24 family protein
MQPTLIVTRGEWSNEQLESPAGGAVPFRSSESLLDVRDRATLVRWIRARTTPQRVVLRSCVVMLLADGLSAREVARRLGVSRHTVDLWRRRYIQEGCDSLLHDRPGRGRKRSSCGDE